MRRWHLIVSTAVACIAAMAHGTELRAQINQREIAQQLLEGGPAERAGALGRVRAIDVRSLSPELRSALLTALEREGEVHARRRRGEVGFLDNPDLLPGLTRVVVGFRDAGAIPGLVGALGSSPPAMHGLAGFGERAAPAVLDVLSRDDSPAVLMDGLITLRLMVEGAATNPLSPATLNRIRGTAERLLTSKQVVTTLWRAIDLAVALSDPALTRTVESIAADRNAVLARGVSDPDLVARTQQRAADRLAGLPASPRRENP